MLDKRQRAKHSIVNESDEHRQKRLSDLRRRAKQSSINESDNHREQRLSDKREKITI